MNIAMPHHRKARRDRKGLGSDRGAELVEFALVMPVLLMLGLGICDFGLLFQRYEVVTNAAREGARVGSTGADDAQITAVVGQYLNAGGLTQRATIQIAQLTVGTPPINAVKVTVSYPNGAFFVAPIAAMFGPELNDVTLRAAATMRLEIQAS